MKWKIIAIISIVLMLIAYAWAGKVTDLDELDDHPAATDVVAIVDVSDDTQASSGTTKKIESHSLFKADVVHKTSSYSVQADDCGIQFTNSGSTGDITFTLPECTASTEGWWASFYVMDTTYEFYVDPHANDSIADISPNENGEHVYGPQTVGALISVLCMKGDDDDYDIYTTGYRGTWTQQD